MKEVKNMHLTNVDIQSVFKCQILVRKMFKDRGYKRIRGVSFDSVQQFKQFVKSNPKKKALHLSIYANVDKKKKVLAVFFEKSKVGIKDIRSLINGMVNLSLDICLIVFYRSSLSHFAKKELLQGPLNVQIFCERNFIDPTRHKFYHPHCKLNEDIANEIIQKAGGKKHLPKLLKSDKISEYFGYEIGNVIQITSSLPRGHISKEYRVVE